MRLLISTSPGKERHAKIPNVAFKKYIFPSFRLDNPAIWLTSPYGESCSGVQKIEPSYVYNMGQTPDYPAEPPGRVKTGNAYPEPPIPQHAPIPFQRGILGRGHRSTRPLAAMLPLRLLVASWQRQGTGAISSPTTTAPGAADPTLYRWGEAQRESQLQEGGNLASFTGTPPAPSKRFPEHLNEKSEWMNREWWNQNSQNRTVVKPC